MILWSNFKLQRVKETHWLYDALEYLPTNILESEDGYHFVMKIINQKIKINKKS